MKKLKALLASVFVAALACSPIMAHADGGFTLKLNADKLANLAVGDVISVTVTPYDISYTEGICSYDAKGITFDSDVLEFDSENVSVSTADFEAYANETESGKISLMVIDMSMTGSELHDGEGAATLKFTVKAEAEQTTISIAGATINATIANAALDSCAGTAGEDLILSFGDTPISQPEQSEIASSASTEPNEGTASAEQTASSASQEASSAVTDDGENDKNSWTWIVVIIAVLAVVAGGVAVMAVKKKKTE